MSEKPPDDEFISAEPVELPGGPIPPGSNFMYAVALFAFELGRGLAQGGYIVLKNRRSAPPAKAPKQIRPGPGRRKRSRGKGKNEKQRKKTI